LLATVLIQESNISLENAKILKLKTKLLNPEIDVYLELLEGERDITRFDVHRRMT
jgi:hypothetical protein